MIDLRKTSTQSFIIVILFVIFFIVFFWHRQIYTLNGRVVDPENLYKDDDISVGPVDDGYADNLDEAIRNQPKIQFFSPVIELDLANGTEFCFADFSFSTWNDASYHVDGGTARFNISDSKVIGVAYYQIAGKDSWRYKYEGTARVFDPKTNSRILDVTEVSESEGITNATMKAQLALSADKIMPLGKIINNFAESKPISCDELTELEGVQQKLRDIEMFHDYVVLDYAANTGYLVTSYFPDKEGKYTQQRKDFSYTTNDKNEVLGLKMK